ncbi:MAG: hydrogenase subunit MbhD domain-containing protein [Lachnospiraceae bacterium]
MTEIFKVILLVALIVCAIAVNVTRGLLQSVVIFMAYSSVMSLVWMLMESPDLAITEAAVGAGLSTILFLLTLRKLRKVDEGLIAEEEEEEEPP